MADNYGSPIQSPSPKQRMTSGQLSVNNAQQNANKKILGNPKVSNTVGQRAVAIERGMSVKDAWKNYPSDPTKLQPKYHR